MEQLERRYPIVEAWEEYVAKGPRVLKLEGDESKATQRQIETLIRYAFEAGYWYGIRSEERNPGGLGMGGTDSNAG